MVPPNNLGPDLNGKSVNETQYRGMIGSLNVNKLKAVPNIQFSTCFCARYQANPKESYLIVVKRIFRYLKDTSSFGLWYPKCLGFDLKGYSDSDYAGCNMDRKSTPAEAEYVAAAGCYTNILWMKSQLTDYDTYMRRYHFIRDHILKWDIELHFIPTQYQLDDIFTKPLDEPTFKRLIVELGEVRREIGITTFINALREQYLPHSGMYVSPPSIITVRPWFTMIGYNEEIRAKGTLKKSYLPPRWRLLMGQIIQCLGRKTDGLDQISNKDATILYCLENGVQVDYAKIIWEDLIHKLNKKTRENIFPYPRFISLLLKYMAPKYDKEELTINPTQVFSVQNWILKPNQPEEPPFTEHMLAVCNLADLNVPKAPKPFIAERVPQGTKLGAKPGYKNQSTSSKQPSVSNREATKGGSSRAPTGSKTNYSQKSKESSSTMDSNLSQPLVSTPVDTEMHKEDQQVAGGPSSLGATSEEGAYPQLSSGSNLSVLVDKTKSARDGLKTAHTTSSANEESEADDISRKVKLEDLSNILKDTRSAFFTPDSPTDDPIILSDESEAKEDAAKDKDTEDISVPPSPSLKSAQIQELIAQPSYRDINLMIGLLVTSLKPELSKLLASHNFASCLPTELKDLPSKITKLSDEIKELKQHVRDIEIELLGDLV
ncbi:hypothetical protein Tco_1335282 [Tanacetum coccineum]